MPWGQRPAAAAEHAGGPCWRRSRGPAESAADRAAASVGNDSCATRMPRALVLGTKLLSSSLCTPPSLLLSLPPGILSLSLSLPQSPSPSPSHPPCRPLKAPLASSARTRAGARTARRPTDCTAGRPMDCTAGRPRDPGPACRPPSRSVSGACSHTHRRTATAHTDGARAPGRWGGGGRRHLGVGITAWSTRTGRLGATKIYTVAHRVLILFILGCGGHRGGGGKRSRRGAEWRPPPYSPNFQLRVSRRPD